MLTTIYEAAGWNKPDDTDVEGITYPSGRALTYSFDATGRVSSLQGVQNSNTTSYAGPITYWGNGGFNQLTLAGGALSQSFTPDYRFRPVTVAANAGSASVLNLGYTYFLNGNVKTVTFTNPGLATALTQTFGYDKTNRLSSAMETAGGSQTWSQNFGYDQFGNRSLLTTSTFNPYPGLTPQSATAGTGPFNAYNRWTGASYDGAGNERSVLAEVGDAAVCDTENRLATMTVPGASVTQYSYDGDGRRVLKVVCPAGTSVCLPSVAGAAMTAYVYDAEGDVAAEYGTPTDSGTKYLFTDGLGSTRLETNAAGGAARCIDYSRFGLATNRAAWLALRIRRGGR